MKWFNLYSIPPIEELKRVGSSDWNEFIRHSNTIAPVIYANLEQYIEPPVAGKRILDFGSGVGRAALQLYARWKTPSHCCDVNPAAISYLERELKSVDCAVNNFTPPLNFEDNYFDAVYSVSVWTHLPPDHQLPWLNEIKRILKPGGLALLSISGPTVLQRQLKKDDSRWQGYTISDLAKAGLLYIEYKSVNTHRIQYPGITASYGSTLHDPVWIHNEWGQEMEILEINVDVIGTCQDLVVMRKHQSD